jgi:hypothetical protein
MENGKCTYIFAGKSEGKCIFKGAWRSCEYCVQMFVKQILRKEANWIYVPQDSIQWPALLNTVMNLQFP